jgi:hypothetical protein
VTLAISIMGELADNLHRFGDVFTSADGGPLIANN